MLCLEVWDVPYMSQAEGLRGRDKDTVFDLSPVNECLRSMNFTVCSVTLEGDSGMSVTKSRIS